MKNTMILMALGIAALSAIPSQAVAQQRKLLLGTNDQGASLFVLPDTVSRSAPAVVIWTRTDAAPNNPTPIRVLAQKAIYDCSARSITVLQREAYNSEGQILDAVIIPPDEITTTTPADGSPEQRSLAIICSAFLGL